MIPVGQMAWAESMQGYNGVNSTQSFGVSRGLNQITGERVALIIGNASYRRADKLLNPVNDARLMGETLKNAGFRLVGGKPLIDGDKSTIEQSIREFGQLLRGGSVGLFYYSGHGLQIKGENYLVPVTADIRSESDVDYELVNASLVLKAMEFAGNRLNIVILDACRNNPFGSKGLRSMTSGLAQVQAPAGTVISYATQPGNVARDGLGNNSPYTEALITTISQPGLDVFATFNQVGLRVKQATGGEQQPWLAMSPIEGVFTFTQPTASPPDSKPQTQLSPSIPTVDRDALFWQSIGSSNKITDFQAYLTQFPAGTYSVLARDRIEELGRQQASVMSIVPRSSPTDISTTATQRPGSVFRDCSECPEMVVVPAGNFNMGSPLDEPERSSDEGPQHRVTIAMSLAVGRYAVTRGEFAQFISETSRAMPGNCMTVDSEGIWVKRPGANWRSPGFQQTERDPVVCVNWDDAKAYVAWLSKKSNQNYRLPTEAEWEYAARSGTTTRYWWGDDARHTAQCAYANGADISTKSKLSSWKVTDCDDSFIYTAPSGRFKPNTFGLYDMLGNVWQWVEDEWSENYQGAHSDSSAFTTFAGSSVHVIRGGSWASNPSRLRSSIRYHNFAYESNLSVGFRVVRHLNHHD